MALQQYTRASIKIAGVGDLGEATSISLKRSTNSTAAVNISKGYVGETPGAVMTELTVESVVPSTGFELDPGPYMQALNPNAGGPNPDGVTFEITLTNGSTFIFTGFIIEDSFSYAINSNAGLSFTVRGEFNTTWN